MSISDAGVYLRAMGARLGCASSIGPASAVLPDTAIGAWARVAGRSVVLRGEELPPGTRWHGAPVTADSADSQQFPGKRSAAATRFPR
jgi:carbonic anhydrase/acetyltransferase-like protein (isoleucine patch superfamily)